MEGNREPKEEMGDSGYKSEQSYEKGAVSYTSEPQCIASNRSHAGAFRTVKWTPDGHALMATNADWSLSTHLMYVAFTKEQPMFVRSKVRADSQVQRT